MEIQTNPDDTVYANELALFRLPTTNSTVERVRWVEHRPVTTAGDDGPLEFLISGGGNQYVDLQRTMLHVRVKVVKENGGSLTDQEHVGPVNLFLHSLWSVVEVQLQQKIVSSTGPLYPYKAYLDTLLRYGTDGETKLQSQLYYPDSSHTIKTADPIMGGNTGLSARADLIAGSNTVDMQGPLLSDICQMSRYLLNGIEISFKLWPSKNSFRLMSDVNEANYKVIIVDALLNVCLITISPEIVMTHNEILETTTAKYPYWRSEIKHFAMSPGQYYFTKDNMFQGKVPTRMIICLVSSEAMSGDFQRNPFNFQHYNIDNITITVDDVSVLGKPLKPKFSQQGGQNFVTAYDAMFSGILNRNNRNIGISRSDYPLGYTVFTFDLDPSLTDRDHWPLLKRGNLKLDLHFETPLTETVEVLIYATFPDLFEVDGSRGILR
jgi:hypothetical protein